MSHETPTFNQVMEQDDAGHDPTVLVKTPEGKIVAGRLDGEFENKDWHVALPADSAEAHDTVPRYALTDEHQSMLADELAADRTSGPETLDTPATKVEHDLADVALSAAINEGVLESRLGPSPEKPAVTKEDEPTEPVESQQERAKQLYDKFKELTDKFQECLEVIGRSQQPQEITYHLTNLQPLIYAVTDSFPSKITDKEIRTNLDMINSMMVDVQYRVSRLNQILEEEGLQTGTFNSSVINIQHHGLLGAMIGTNQKISNA